MTAILTTDVYWDVAGTELNRLCWNITTLGDGRSSVPTWRGEDQEVAYRPGTLHMPKTPQGRVLPLRMWVNDYTDMGVEPTLRDQGFNDNVRALRALFWKDDGSEVPLTKRWRESGVVKSATALVSLTGPMAPTMQGRFAGSMDVDLFLANPWFYEPASTAHLLLATPFLIPNTGDARTTGYGERVVFNGPLTNPKVTNGSVWFQLGSTVAAGDSVTVDMWDWTAIRTSDGASLVGAITHSGARQWMYLSPGSQNVTLTATAGTGTADYTYRSPRF